MLCVVVVGISIGSGDGIGDGIVVCVRGGRGVGDASGSVTGGAICIHDCVDDGV